MSDEVRQAARHAEVEELTAQDQPHGEERNRGGRSEPDLTALISAYRKDEELVHFARGLAELGFELWGSAGTAQYLSHQGVQCHSIEKVVGHAGLIGGRVKTLHPAIFAGILWRQDDEEELAQFGATRFNLVAVDLYPFPERGEGVTLEDAVELIDIGGVALIRAAAKNFHQVVVVPSRDHYGMVLAGLREGENRLAWRRRLAAEAFRLTSTYDQRIARLLEVAGLEKELAGGETGWIKGIPQRLELELIKVEELRYGENPHQQGARYLDQRKSLPLVEAKVLSGKQMSYTNWLDLASAVEVLRGRPAGKQMAVVVKHQNPCCVAVGSDPMTTWERAIAGDPMSAFGGIVAVSFPVDQRLARAITREFREILAAPTFEPEALSWLRENKKNLRAVEVDPAYLESPPSADELSLRHTPFGVMATTRDGLLEKEEELTSAGKISFPPGKIADALLGAWLVRHLMSNAALLIKDGVMVGYGCGQPSRVKAVRDAVERAGDRAAGSVLISDAFFPFPDSLEVALRAGVRMVATPFGSINDEKVIEWADRHGIALLRLPYRHFRH